MKLKTIILAFNPLTQVYDSIEDFNRKWELLPAFKELKDAVDMFDLSKNKLVEKYKHGDVIPPDVIPIVNQQLNEIVEQDIKLINQFEVTKEEVEKSKLKGSEIINIIDFLKQK